VIVSSSYGDQANPGTGSTARASSLDQRDASDLLIRVRTTIYVMTMTRTTVYLSQDAKRRLSAAAHRRHRSEAELIRDAIDQLLADEPERPRPNPPQLDLDPAAIDNLDEHLSAGFGADGLEGGSWHS